MTLGRRSTFRIVDVADQAVADEQDSCTLADELRTGQGRRDASLQRERDKANRGRTTRIDILKEFHHLGGTMAPVMRT